MYFSGMGFIKILEIKNSKNGRGNEEIIILIPGSYS